MVVGIKGLRHLDGRVALVDNVGHLVNGALMLLADVVPALKVSVVVEKDRRLGRRDEDGGCSAEHGLETNHVADE